MAKPSIAGGRPLAPSARINLYGPTFPRAMSRSGIREMAEAFGKAVHLAKRAEFDAVEVHAGHGYLISQYLSPYTNKRRDEYGGSLENRSRFLQMVMEEVKQAAGSELAVLVKMNMRDGFRGGLEQDEALEIARMLERWGADALVLSGGFVSRAPMYILRGAMPVGVLAHYMKDPFLKSFVRLFGRRLIPPETFREGYFLEEALTFRQRIGIPLVYVGGLLSRHTIEEVLGAGFELVGIARALIRDPGFINRLYGEALQQSGCDTCNYCIAAMYSREAACIQNLPDTHGRLRKMLDRP